MPQPAHCARRVLCPGYEFNQPGYKVVVPWSRPAQPTRSNNGSSPMTELNAATWAPIRVLSGPGLDNRLFAWVMDGTDLFVANRHRCPGLGHRGRPQRARR